MLEQLYRLSEAIEDGDMELAQALCLSLIEEVLSEEEIELWEESF
jgi:hypothetical protein